MRAKGFFRIILCGVLGLAVVPAGAHQDTEVLAQVVGAAGGELAPLPPAQNTTPFFLSFTAQAVGTYEGSSGTGTYSCSGGGTRSGNLAIDFVQATFACDAVLLVANWPHRLFGELQGQRVGPTLTLGGGVHDGDQDRHAFNCVATLLPNGTFEGTCRIH